MGIAQLKYFSQRRFFHCGPSPSLCQLDRMDVRVSNKKNTEVKYKVPTQSEKVTIIKRKLLWHFVIYLVSNSFL